MDDIKLPIYSKSRNGLDSTAHPTINTPGSNIAPVQVYSSMKKSFPNAHVYNIHTVSIHNDGSSFLSADDLRVNIWDIEDNTKCFSKYCYWLMIA